MSLEQLTKPMQDSLNRIVDEGLRTVIARLGVQVLKQETEEIPAEKTEPTVQDPDEYADEEEWDAHKLPPEERYPAREHHLPSWAENRRGVPNPVLRGALFAAIQGKTRRALKAELLATQKGVEIRFTGWQLDQADLDVWKQVLHMHMIQDQPLGVQLSFSARSLLVALGLSTGKSDYNWLKDSFRRLAGAVVEISFAPGMSYAGNMLDFWRDDNDKSYIIEVNPRLACVYATGWTAIDQAKRQEFRRKPLALWLLGYYSSHAKPFAVTVGYLYRLSGSCNKNLRDFKYQLRKGLQLLVEHGVIRSFSVVGDLVKVEVIPSQSQQRYLDRQSVSQRTRYTTDTTPNTGHDRRTKRLEIRDTTDALTNAEVQ